jgi:hypothetical protein
MSQWPLSSVFSIAENLHEALEIRLLPADNTPALPL